MTETIDFASEFARLSAEGRPERTVSTGGVDIRLVRVAAAGEGRWDSHQDGTETVIVWSGLFEVAFRDRTLRLGAGQCCVVPVAAQHRGTSPGGAEVILFRASAPTD